MIKQRVSVVALAALILGAFALGGGDAEAARGGSKSATLAYTWSGRAHWVTYSIDSTAGGVGDVAVFHTCYDTSGAVVYQEARRFFYSDNAGKHGTSDVWVEGASCSAFVAPAVGGGSATAAATLLTNAVKYSTAGMY
jgi:hypothetical protein